MDFGRDLAAAAGALLILATGWSVIGTVVVPRRIRSRLPRLVAISVDATFHFFADRFDSYEPRDRILAAQAPIQIILQIVAWLAAFEVSFALVMWPFAGNSGLPGAFEQAGSALCTLGYLAPRSSGGAALDSLAALCGLGTVALQIGYLPTLYSAFNRREALVTLLDSRAGVPSWGPELLARTHYGLGTGVSAVGELPGLFEEWERWSADVAESHTTYLTLVNFRSPRPLSSWVTAQLAVLDAAALCEAVAMGIAQREDPGALRTLRHYEQQRRTQNLMMDAAMSVFRTGFAARRFNASTLRRSSPSSSTGVSRMNGFFRNFGCRRIRRNPASPM